MNGPPGTVLATLPSAQAHAMWRQSLGVQAIRYPAALTFGHASTSLNATSRSTSLEPPGQIERSRRHSIHPQSPPLGPARRSPTPYIRVVRRDTQTEAITPTRPPGGQRYSHSARCQSFRQSRVPELIRDACRPGAVAGFAFVRTS